MIKASRSLAILALTASAGVHAAGLAALWQHETVEIEGGAEASVAVLGNSFQDVISGSADAAPPDTVPPEEVLETAEPPDQTEPVDPQKVAETAPIGPTDKTPTEDARSAEKVQVTTQADAPAKDTEAKAVPTETVVTEAPIETALLKPTVEPLPQVSTVITVAPTPQEQAEPAEVTEALPEAETGPAPSHSARPKARPKSVEQSAAAQRPKIAKRPAKPKKPIKKAAKPAQKGANQPDQTKGTTDGQAKAKTSNSSKRKAKASAAGTAAISNYPGEVMRKISRLRRPRVNSRGTAMIAFSVSSSGNLAGVRVARSSGSARLDQAAVQLVRRAAPFPRPPTGAQRNFTIGIKGR